MARLTDLSINDLKPNQILGVDICDANNRVLLKKSTVLTPELIATIKSRLIKKVTIQASDHVSLDAARSIAHDIKQSVDFRFRYVEKTPELKALKELLCKQLFKGAIEEADK